MKGQDTNTTTKILHLFDGNRDAWRSLMPFKSACIQDFNKPNRPPPTLQKLSSSYKTLTISVNISSLHPRVLSRDDTVCGLFLLLYLLPLRSISLSCCCLLHGSLHFGGTKFAYRPHALSTRHHPILLGAPDVPVSLYMAQERC